MNRIAAVGTGRAGAAAPASDPAPLRVRAASPRLQRLRVIFALMVREMGTKFGRSAGGYLWAIAEPLGGILLLAVAFSLALRSPPLGTSFILFYATGIMPFSMFNALSRGVSGAVSSNKGLLTYPVVSTLDAVLAKVVLNFLTTALVAALLFAGILFSVDMHVNLALGPITLSFALAALLGTGIGTLNCVLFGFFPTWKNIWAVLTRPLFIISGIFFTYESVPQAFQAVLWWNPLVHVIGVMRSGFYGGYEPHFVSYPYVLGIAFGTFVIGGYLLRRHASFLIEQ
jgi:capsular polysaccharide transport system permease protein